MKTVPFIVAQATYETEKQQTVRFREVQDAEGRGLFGLGFLYLSKDRWKALGKPRSITIVVENGDGGT